MPFIGNESADILVALPRSYIRSESFRSSYSSRSDYCDAGQRTGVAATERNFKREHCSAKAAMARCVHCCLSVLSCPAAASRLVLCVSAWLQADEHPQLSSAAI